MIIHQREVGYGENYPTLFATLVKAEAYSERLCFGKKIELRTRL